MKYITLNNGLKIKIDNEDYEFLSKWKWGCSNSGYAMRISHTGKDKIYTYRAIYTHRLLAKTPQGMETDHINRDKLDNRKSNLRVVIRATNNYNRPLQPNNTSGHTGITWNKAKEKWQVYVGSKYLGIYKELKEAINVRKANIPND